MTREPVTQPDGRMLQVLTFEGPELSEWQKTYPRNPVPGMAPTARWIGDNKLVLGLLPCDPPVAASPVTAGGAAAHGGAAGALVEDGLEAKTVAELKTECGKRSLSYTSSMTKADLLELLRGKLASV